MEHGLGDQKTRITPDLQEIWSTTQTKLDPLAIDSQVLDFSFAPSPSQTDLFTLCNLHSHVRQCAMFPKSGWGDNPKICQIDLANGT